MSDSFRLQSSESSVWLTSNCGAGLLEVLTKLEKVLSYLLQITTPVFMLMLQPIVEVWHKGLTGESNGWHVGRLPPSLLLLQSVVSPSPLPLTGAPPTTTGAHFLPHNPTWPGQPTDGFLTQALVRVWGSGLNWQSSYSVRPNTWKMTCQCQIVFPVSWTPVTNSP